MSTGANVPMFHRVGLEDLGKRWLLVVAFGMLLILFGFIAISSLAVMITTSWIFVLFIGWLLLFSGAFQVVYAFATRCWSGFFLDLLSGLLSLVVGFLMITQTQEAKLAITLLIALFLIFGGMFRVLVGVAVDMRNRWWMVLNGAVSLLLGFAIWNRWPEDAYWVIGLFVGIDMIFNGASLLALGLAAKQISSAAKAL